MPNFAHEYASFILVIVDSGQTGSDRLHKLMWAWTLCIASVCTFNCCVKLLQKSSHAYRILLQPGRWEGPTTSLLQHINYMYACNSVQLQRFWRLPIIWIFSLFKLVDRCWIVDWFSMQGRSWGGRDSVCIHHEHVKASWHVWAWLWIIFVYYTKVGTITTQLASGRDRAQLGPFCFSLIMKNMG